MNEKEREARSPITDERSAGEIAHGALRGTIAVWGGEVLVGNLAHSRRVRMAGRCR